MTRITAPFYAASTSVLFLAAKLEYIFRLRYFAAPISLA
jgi:hypothetical protein